MRESELDQLHRELEQEQRKLVPESTWEPNMETAAEYKVAVKPSIAERVHQVLIDLDYPVSSADIAEVIGDGITGKQVSSAITSLSLRLNIERSGQNKATKYRLVGDKPAKRTEIETPVVNHQMTTEPYDNVVQFAPVAESRQCDPLLHHLDVIKASVSAIEFYAADLHAPPIETIPHDEQDRVIGALREVQAILNPSMAASIEAAIIHLQDYFGGSVNAAV